MLVRLHCLQSISEENQRGLAANGYREPDVETKLSRLRCLNKLGKQIAGNCIISYAATNEQFTGNLIALITAFHSDNGKESMSGVLRVENPKVKTKEVT
ncbi:MAG: hypothetical protein Q9173_007009 [Seirophora scorigena]